MLSKLIGNNAIQLNVEAYNWEEAIYKAAKPLLESNKVTERYVEKVVQIAKETGPYIVIAKHIALPHAPSEYGALESSLSITVLNQSVEFGNKANDPVKYLFFLSAADSTSHLAALANLVELMEDETFLSLLDTTNNSSEILDYIKNMENK